MIASEKAVLSLICSVTGGILNMALDYVFIAGLDMGIGGAAVATGLGYSVTAVAGLFVFSRKKSLLHFKKPVFRIRVLGSAASNGCSEMATALVTGIVTMMFNWTMLHYVGCPYAELLLRRTEPRKTEKAGWVEYESDRGDFCDYGCGFLCDDKAAGIRICQNG